MNIAQSSTGKVFHRRGSGSAVFNSLGGDAAGAAVVVAGGSMAGFVARDMATPYRPQKEVR
jgi:hypothetical protein